MQEPNFTQLADDLRSQRLDQIDRDKRYQAWLDRPLVERESVIVDNLLNGLRGLGSEFTKRRCAEELHDHFASTPGMDEFTELLNAVAEEDSGRAWELLKKACGPVAKRLHEDEGGLLEWDDLTYVDWDSRR